MADKSRDVIGNIWAFFDKTSNATELAIDKVALDVETLGMSCNDASLFLFLLLLLLLLLLDDLL